MNVYSFSHGGSRGKKVFSIHRTVHSHTHAHRCPNFLPTGHSESHMRSYFLLGRDILQKLFSRNGRNGETLQQAKYVTFSSWCSFGNGDIYTLTSEIALR